ncbi:MAG: hypothetical protein ACE5GN_07940, partial [Waddliaceae bacterium]
VDVLVPLAVGNHWAYQNSVFIGDRRIEGLTDSVVVRIIGQTTVTFEGQSFDIFIREFFHPRTNTAREAKWFDWNGEDGFYLLGGMSSTDTLVHKVLQLKFPVEVGESWQVPLLVYNLIERRFMFEDTLTFTSVTTDTAFETLVGTFQCHVYHYQRSQGEDILLLEDVFDYYAPGQGFVGREVKTVGILKSRVTLYDFQIN